MALIARFPQVGEFLRADETAGNSRGRKATGMVSGRQVSSAMPASDPDLGNRQALFSAQLCPSQDGLHVGIEEQLVMPVTTGMIRVLTCPIDDKVSITQ